MQLQQSAPPDDLIGLAEAARLLPSIKPGRRVHLQSIYRWLERGRLKCWKRGRHKFVSRAEILAMHRQM